MRQLMIVAVLAGLCVGCGGGGGGAAPTGPGALLAGTVGPEGGTLSVSNAASPYAGLALSVPPGALPQATNIEVRAIEHPHFPGSMYAFSLEPAGLQMAQPCELVVPYDPSVLGDLASREPDALVVLHHSDVGDIRSLSPTQIDTAGGTAAVSIDHFSRAYATQSEKSFSTCSQETLIDTQFRVETARTVTNKVVTYVHPKSGEHGLLTELGHGDIDDFWRTSSRNLVLVHGWTSDAAAFANAGGLVEALKPYFDNIAIFQYRTGDSAATSGARLAQFFVERAQPGFRCSVVTHSMGGLVARHAIEAYPDAVAARVDALVTLCTPHEGSNLAALAGIGTTCEDSQLDLLNGRAEPPIQPVTEYFLVGGSTTLGAVPLGERGDGLVTVASSLGLDFVPSVRTRVFSQSHSSIHKNAASNDVGEQVVTWLQPDRATWAKQEDGLEVISCAAFADGAVVVTGVFGGTAILGEGANTVSLTSAGSFDVFVARYDSSGDLEWAHRAGGSNWDYGTHVAALADGSCVLTGGFQETATFGAGVNAETLTHSGEGGYDFFVAKYDFDGVLSWADSPGNGIGTGVAPLSGGGCLVLGILDGHTNTAVTRYDSEGGVTWAKHVADHRFPADAIAAYPDGSFVVAGHFQGTVAFGLGADEVSLSSSGPADTWDMCIFRCSPQGDLVWAKRAGGEGYDEGVNVVTLSDGSCLVRGYYWGTAEFGEGPGAVTLTAPRATGSFLARYSSDGDLVWAKRDGGLCGEARSGLCALGDDSFVVAGWFAGTTTFGQGAGAASLMSAGSTDICYARYNSDGTLHWAKRAGGTGGDRISCLALLADETPVVIGFLGAGVATFGEGPSAVPLDQADGMNFIVRLNSSGGM